MLIGKFRHLPSARCTLHKTLFDKERLIDLLDGSGVFAQRGSDGSQSHRTSFKLVDNGAQNLVVYLVEPVAVEDRKSTRLNSSHANISYAVFCLKKKNNITFSTKMSHTEIP